MTSPGNDSEQMVWRIRSVEGHSWLRELYENRPIISGLQAEAAQFDTRADADAVLATLTGTPKLIPFQLVEGPATKPFRRGVDRPD